jgi:predicted RNA-binding protein with PIN domain
MRFLVDGHNLIPKLGLRLSEVDDEQMLIDRLQNFCRLHRVTVEVYFDGAAPGTVPMRKSGAVTAHFVRLGSSADAAIENRLGRLGKLAGEWTVVSSDGRVQAAAHAVHTQVLSSEEFTRKITATSHQAEASERDKDLSPEEVDEWLRTFKSRKN